MKREIFTGIKCRVGLDDELAVHSNEDGDVTVLTFRHKIRPNERRREFVNPVTIQNGVQTTRFAMDTPDAVELANMIINVLWRKRTRR